MGKIFISHSSANNAEALAIFDWLAEQGWGDVFLDLDPRRGLVAGDRWQAALKSAAEQCELILILISPAWAKSKWCLAEFLLAKQMNKQILGVVVQETPLADLPVELTAEWQLVDLSASDAGWSVTLSPPRYEPETKVHFSGTGLARLRAGLEKAGLDATTFIWPPATDLGRSPYRGLLPLDQDDAGIFFGRDGAIVLAIDALRGLREAAAPRFVTILGASGAGKSSFLRAGLLPRLARDSRNFYVLPPVRPGRAALTGEHGFAAMLEAALKSRGITRNRADIRDAVQSGATAVAPILSALAVPADAGDAATGEPPTLVITIDQAEELLSGDAAETAALLDMLAGLGRRDDPAVMVIFTVRSDSFDQLQARTELAPTQPHHLIDLPPIPAGAYGEIVRGPARRVTAAGRKLHVDETLVDALLSDIEAGGTKDALPLLAFTLERLYTDYGADGDLQLAEYEKLGRIRGAIEEAVNTALTAADGNPAIPADRAARLALLRRGLIPWLAGIDPATGSPRRRVARMAEVPEEARPLIELMVEQRLLATDIDPVTKERTIEPAHEALLRQWGALDGWLAEDSADLATIEALRRAASEWDANARAAEFIVHRGARLAAVEQVAAEHKFAAYLTSGDRDYLAAAHDIEAAAQRKARAARTRLAIAGAVAGIVLVAGSTAGWFIYQAGEAARLDAAVSFELARAEASLRGGRPEEAAIAAMGAYALKPDTATRTMALTAAMSVSPHAAGIVPVTTRIADTGFDVATGQAIALAADGTITRIDPASHRIVDGGTRGGEIMSLAASAANLAQPIALGRDGATILNADASLSDTAGTLIAAAPAAAFAARTGRTGDDGRLAGFIGLAGDALIRDCRALPCVDTLLPPPQPGQMATSLAIRPDGEAFAINWTGEIALYEDPAAAPVGTIALPPDSAKFGAALAMDWSAAGDRIALGTDSGHLIVIDPLAGTILADNAQDFSAISLAWSPTEPVLAASCDGRTLCLYDDTLTVLDAWQGHRGRIGAIHWSADGETLVSQAPDDPVRLWSRDADSTVSSHLRIPGWTALTALATDPATGRVAAGDNTGTIWLWDAEGERSLYRAPGDLRAVTSLAFLSDGRIAAVHQSRAVAVWSADKTEPDTFITLENLSFSRIAAATGDIRAVVPLSDKTILVLSGDQLREARIAPDTIALDQWGVTAAPAANSVFLSYSDGTIRRRDLGAGTAGVTQFDASQPVCGLPPTTDNNGARSLDVSADGKWLVATRTDAQIVVHNLADPAATLCLPLPAADSKTVAFSPDSKYLAILSATDRLYVYDLANPTAPLIFDAPAVPDGSPIAVSAGTARTTSWLAWRDPATLAIATVGGAVELVRIDPEGWRSRVDTLLVTQ